MKNNKAQIFIIWIVFLTLVLCGLAIYMYFNQQKDVACSIVSPIEILELKEKKSLFEIQERNIIIISAKQALCDEFSFDSGNFLCTSESEFGSEVYMDNFEKIFFNYLVQPEQEQFREFLFSNLSFNNQEILLEALDEIEEQEAFFKSIYSVNFDDDNSVLIIERKPVGKHFILRANELDKINFVVGADYVYKEKYLIEKEDLI